jgi:hypothetical protein
MTDAITTIQELTPLGAIIVLAGIVSSICTQVAKRAHWTKGQTEVVALVMSAVLGAVAYIVSGVALGLPDGLVQTVSTVVLTIAGVAVASRFVYGMIGHAVPDGTEKHTHRED